MPTPIPAQQFLIFLFVVMVILITFLIANISKANKLDERDAEIIKLQSQLEDAKTKRPGIRTWRTYQIEMHDGYVWKLRATRVTTYANNSEVFLEGESRKHDVAWFPMAGIKSIVDQEQFVQRELSGKPDPEPEPKVALDAQ